MTIEHKLFSLQDLEYKKFHCALMPTVDPDTVIGVRVPELRKFAKNIKGTTEAENFLLSLPHNYYEENNLHAFLIQQEKDFDQALSLTKDFLPYINNWATCDMFRPAVFKKNPEKLIVEIYKWIKSDKTYTVRFAIGLLLSSYLDENFKPEYLDVVAKINSGEYYINIMAAWYFQTALVKQYDTTLPYITGRRLYPWVHNKTIRKSVESLRISKEIKEFLKTLIVKE